MDRGANQPAAVRASAVARRIPGDATPLVGRRDALRAFEDALDASSGGAFRFLVLVGEPGAGKTRLLDELAASATRRALPALLGRAAEFEQEMPFGAVIDALDDHVEASLPGLAGRLGTETSGLLATVLPAVRAAASGQAARAVSGPGSDLIGRHRVYRGMRRLLEDLADPHGLVLILDDVHWADSASVELLDHLVRHPPPGGVLLVVAYRPAQASARLAALLGSAGEHGHEVAVGPLNLAEAQELLGPELSRSHCQALHDASGGNPFYLEALARMDQQGNLMTSSGGAELPASVQAALRLELDGLSPVSLRVAQAAAVAADEFEPALAAVAAQVSEDEALAALNDVAARDLVRPTSAGRLRFRHPLVRRVTYDSAAAGWRLGAHARIAAHLAEVGAPAALRAHHVERSAPFGDQAAIATLLEAARDAAAQAPATAAHWLEVALKMTPAGTAGPDQQLELLLELARLRAVSGQLADGREAAREALRRLPLGDHARRALAARFCALMERQLDRPREARAVLLGELHRIPDPQSAAALPLRTRLVAESLMRGDILAAQAVLDLIPERADALEPSVAVAIAALRPMPAFALGRVTDAARYIEAAGQLVSAAPDDYLADWLDAIAWLCWTETMMGRYDSALAHFDRAIAIARSTGQGYIISNLLAGQAQVQVMFGRLDEASAAAEEAVEVARLLGSRFQLVFALAQQCLAESWSGEDLVAVRLGEEAVRTGQGNGEWPGAQAQYALAIAMINAGSDAGRDALALVCDRVNRSMLDRRSLLFASEVMAGLEADRGNLDEASRWAARAAKFACPGQEATAWLARARAMRASEPGAAAVAAGEAAQFFDGAGLLIESGRARLCAGLAWDAAGDRSQAVAELALAAQTFDRCGAHSLYGATAQEQRRLGVRVSVAGKGAGAHGLTQRQLEVVKLIGEGLTNQQIADSLFLTIRTVETHISHIFAKLGVTTRTGILRALRESS
jgi:DNA-binding CsgD family transcriptional regulator/tetratricopeptide (TPR) repeat protein